MPPAPPRLTAAQLSFTYPRAARPALMEVDLRLDAGQIVAIVGESGSGKSTLGLLLCGALRPNRGRVTRPGAGRITMILQSPALNPMQRIQTQLEAVIRRHEPGRDRRARATEVLARVGLEPAALRAYPHQLSGGMQQRVIVAMSLIGQVDVLIADEPTSALDSLSAYALLELLKALRDQAGVAIVLITHQLKHAAWVADQVAVMHAGRLSTPQEAGAFFQDPLDPHGRALLEAARALDLPCAQSQRH